MKIDLHRHLEGSHSAAALCAVAETHGLKDPLFWDDVAGRYRTVDEVAPALTMAGPTDDARVFYACIQKARAAYVRAEVIADLYGRIDVSPLLASADLWLGVAAAAAMIWGAIRLRRWRDDG